MRVRWWMAALVVLAAGCADQDESGATERTVRTLVFSAIPDQDETRLREKFAPVATYLSERLGVPVEYLHANDYADAVEHFKNADVQLAWFGGLSGVQARHAVAGARAIAQGAEDPDFYSYFIAHPSTGIEAGDAFPLALEGKRFTFGDKLSTSGRLMPEHFIRKHTGEPPAEFFGHENHYSGSHDATAELVASGQFAAGVINYQVYDRRVKEGETDPEVCRVIWQTPPYPDYNFTAHPILDEWFGDGFIDRLQDALIAMKDPALLAAFPRSGLIAASNQDFEPVAELARELAFIR